MRKSSRKFCNTVLDGDPSRFQNPLLPKYHEFDKIALVDCKDVQIVIGFRCGPADHQAGSVCGFVVIVIIDARILIFLVDFHIAGNIVFYKIRSCIEALRHIGMNRLWNCRRGWNLNVRGGNDKRCRLRRRNGRFRIILGRFAHQEIQCTHKQSQQRKNDRKQVFTGFSGLLFCAYL